MKKKSKVVLSMGAALAAVAATGVATGFAWFTTTRTATVTYQNATVTSDRSSLSLTAISTDDVATTPAQDANGVLALSSKTSATDNSGQIYDVSSGDGKSFVELDRSKTPAGWDKTNDTSTYVYKAVSATDLPKAIVVFGFRVSVSGSETLNVYFTNNTSIRVENAGESATTGDEIGAATSTGTTTAQHILASTRCAILTKTIASTDVETDSTKYSDATTKLIWDQVANNQYAKAPEDSKPNGSTPTLTGTVQSGKFTTGAENAEPNDKTSAPSFLCTVSAAQAIDVFVVTWIEGTNTYSNIPSSTANGSVVSYSFGLASYAAA
jgi:hypothetical protein